MSVVEYMDLDMNINMYVDINININMDINMYADMQLVSKYYWLNMLKQ